MKKIVFPIVVIIISFFCTNINAQTLKKQKTNKERFSKNTRTESNIKSAVFSKEEKEYITSPKKDPEQLKKLEVNRKSSKIKMISLTSVIINTPNNNLTNLEPISVFPSLNSQNTNDIRQTRGVTIKQKNMQLNTDNKYSKIKMKSITFNSADSAINIKSDLNTTTLDKLKYLKQREKIEQTKNNRDE